MRSRGVSLGFRLVDDLKTTRVIRFSVLNELDRLKVGTERLFSPCVLFEIMLTGEIFRFISLH